MALAHDDVFDHLSHRHYLAKGLSLRQRVHCVLVHYRFEEGAFGQAFPHNSPGFFCFAALQGIALALGMRQAVAVKAACQSAWKPADARHFANAYDGFRESLGGVPMAGRCWRIALPFPLKPLSDVPARHRKQAALRRGCWQAIERSARLALQRHLAGSAAY